MVLAAGVVADLMSGVVHWVADTWGHESWPVIGPRLLRPFRVHHVNPDDMLGRGFLDLNGDVALLTLPLLATAWLLPTESRAGLVAATFFTAWAAWALPTNQVHQWAHMVRPPRAVRWLQRAAHRPAAGRASRASRVAVRDPLLHHHRLEQRVDRPDRVLHRARTDRHAAHRAGAARRRGAAMRPWRFTLRTIEPRHFGSGWISGVLAAALGFIGFGAVVCFHYPSIFTVPELRALYPLAYMRALLHLVLVGAFVLGAISVTLRQNKALGVSGIGFALAAALLGGSQVPVDGELTQGPFLGLDWFLLSLMLYSATFVPLERLFALRPEQDVFRPAWRTDLIYFGMSALLLQLTTLLTMRPAMVFFDWAASARVQAWVVEPAGRRAVPRDPRADRRLPVPGSIAPSTACRCCGASTRSTIRPRRWTGSPARACTSSTWR